REANRAEPRSCRPQRRERGFEYRLLIVSRAIKIRFEVADAHLCQIALLRYRRREGRRSNCQIAAVCAIYCFKNNPTIFDAAADRTDLVHSPAQAHRSVPAYPAVGGSQAGDTASR